MTTNSTPAIKITIVTSNSTINIDNGDLLTYHNLKKAMADEQCIELSFNNKEETVLNVNGKHMVSVTRERNDL